MRRNYFQGDYDHDEREDEVRYEDADAGSSSRVERHSEQLQQEKEEDGSRKAQVSRPMFQFRRQSTAPKVCTCARCISS